MLATLFESAGIQQAKFAVGIHKSHEAPIWKRHDLLEIPVVDRG